MLADIASHVYVINKNPAFKGEQVLIDNLLTKKNVEVIYDVKTTQILGDGFVSGLKYKDQNSQEHELKVDGIFVHIDAEKGGRRFDAQNFRCFFV